LLERLRDRKTMLGFGISAAIIALFIFSAHLNPAQVWDNIRLTDVRLLALALAVYFGAFFLRGLRWRLLLRKADLGSDVKISPLHRLIEMIYLSSFVNCLVPAKLGDGYRAYLFKKETGADMGRVLGTVVGERMADVLALVALLAISSSLVVGQLAGAHDELGVILLAALGLAGAVGAAVAGLKIGSGRLVGLLPQRWQQLFGQFVEVLLRTFRRDLQLPLYGLTALIWAGEVLRIWLVLLSFHITGLAPSVVAFTALAGSLLSTIPFTPAGLGAVEGASVAILGAFGVASSLAGAVAVLDRVINYWSNIPVGGLVYLVYNRRNRGMRGDESQLRGA
jgi:glycosyltransferase 2 family protein